MYLKNNTYTLIQKDFIAKKKEKCYHLNLQQVIILLLVDGLASVLMASDWSGWWLLKIGVAVVIS